MKTLKRKVKEALMVWKVKAEQKVQQYSCLERQTKANSHNKELCNWRVGWVCVHPNVAIV